MNMNLVGLGTNDLNQAIPHRDGSGICICQTQDVVWLCVSFQKDFSDPHSENLSLSGTWSGYDHNRPINNIDSLALLNIEG